MSRSALFVILPSLGVRADLVTYGKTLGGGLPVGVLCGRAALMKRFRDDRPADICFARGTFNAHPYVMASMNVFLRHWISPECKALVDQAEQVWEQRLVYMNHQLDHHQLPIRFAGMQTIWSLIYLQPSRYNWMFQFYLRRQGIALSWVGTGRMIFSLNFTVNDFDALINAFVTACQEMQADGWWWQAPTLTSQGIKRQVLKETIRKSFGKSTW